MTTWMAPEQVEVIQDVSADLAAFYNKPLEVVVNQIVCGIERDQEIQRVIREEIHRSLEKFNVNLTGG